MLGMVAGSWPVSLMIDRTGPRPILIINVLGMTALAALWALSADGVASDGTTPARCFSWPAGPWWAMFISIGHYFQNVIPTGKHPEYEHAGSLVVQGAAAGLSGTLIGGGLLELLRELGLGGYGDLPHLF